MGALIFLAVVIFLSFCWLWDFFGYSTITLILSPVIFMLGVVTVRAEFVFLAVLVFIIFVIQIPGSMRRKHAQQKNDPPPIHSVPTPEAEPPMTVRLPGGYPLLPDIETVLDNDTITSSGYAARYPGQFKHWKNGPDNVFGEKIDPEDWELWRASYYDE